jgi:Rrf2 family protein
MEAWFMLSVTGEYALRAMVYLARNAEFWPIPGPRIAEAAGVPRKYLSSILADLVRTGLLEGTRGKSGGFQMTRPAKAVSLAQVVAPFEPITANRKSCPFADKICNDKDPCAAHDRWKEVKASLVRFLEETSLQDVAAKASDGSKGGRKK